MNRALWTKAIVEARLLLLAMAALMFAFNWLFVWITSMIELGAFGVFLQTLPPEFEKLSGVQFASVATTLGRVSMAYVDPVVIFGTTIWAIARGSDAVSGEIGRGTMEMVLAQPVRRISVLATQAIVTTAGSAILALATWLGTAAGVRTVALDEPVSLAAFVPGAVNLFAYMFFLAGFSTLMSSWDNYRWRTIGLVGTFYILQTVFKVIARLVPRFDWLLYCTFEGAVEPQALVIDGTRAWDLSLRYDGVLFGLGLASYIVAALIFCRRDLPAPL